jgi:hypothetical protein
LMNRGRRGKADDVPRPATAVLSYREARYPILQWGSVRIIDVEEAIGAKARVESDSNAPLSPLELTSRSVQALRRSFLPTSTRIFPLCFSVKNMVSEPWIPAMSTGKLRLRL